MLKINDGISFILYQKKFKGASTNGKLAGMSVKCKEDYFEWD